MQVKRSYPINEQRLISTFIDLASIPSPSWHEHKVISYIESRLKKLGIQTKKHPCEESFNLLAVLEGSKQRRGIMLSAHMDTVHPCESIKPVVTATRISSDGTSVLGGDDKAAIAMFIEAFEVIKEHNLPHGKIEMLLSCAEEVGLRGIKGFDTSFITAKTGFVFDSSGPIGTMILKAPYQYNLKLKVKGKAAHAGMEPEKGINAIVVLSNIIAKLPNGRIDEETTLNVGIISGGVSTNIVTPTAECILEMRSINLDKINSLENLVRTTAKERCAAFKAKLQIEKSVQYHGFILKENDLTVQIADKAVRAIGLKPIHIASGGGSDTNIFNKSKISAINLSCGMKNIHTTQEFIEIKDLFKGANLVLSLISEA